MAVIYDQFVASKLVHWELAKGHLRAIVAIQGMASSRIQASGFPPDKYPHQELRELFEKFFKEVEDQSAIERGDFMCTEDYQRKET